MTDSTEGASHSHLKSFFISTAKAIEPLLETEIRTILSQAGQTAPAIALDRAGVRFEGSIEQAMRICLHSRLANRVTMDLKTFEAPHADGLYGGVRSIHWTEHLPQGATFAVHATLAQGQVIPRRDTFRRSVPESKLPLTHTHFIALRTKDAIVDQLRALRGDRPTVDAKNPDLRIHVHIEDQKATVAIDLSGESLHRRGYRPALETEAHAPVRRQEPSHSRDRFARTSTSREDAHREEAERNRARPQRESPATLKETLAAAILTHCGYGRADSSGKAIFLPLIDPFCGSGTIALEALLMALKIAPGLMRNRFGFEGWAGFDAPLWERLKNEALSVAHARMAEFTPREARVSSTGARVRARAAEPLRIFGSDADGFAVRAARACRDSLAKRASELGLHGVERFVQFEKCRVEDLESPWPKLDSGFLVMNPPYGERMGEVEELKGLYRAIGDQMKHEFVGWTGYVFTASRELAGSIGLKSSARHVLYNGSLECRLIEFKLHAGTLEQREPRAPGELRGPQRLNDSGESQDSGESNDSD